MAKWQIIITITDLKDKYNAESLAREVKEGWMPPSHDITLDGIKVGLVKIVDKDN